MTFFTLLLVNTVVLAQWYNPQKVEVKLGYKYAEALNEARYRNYPKAIELLDECIKTDAKFVDAYLSKAGIFSEQKKYKQSVETYRVGKNLDSVYFSNFSLPYSIALAGNGDFEEALSVITTYLQKPNLNERVAKSAQYRKGCYEFAVNYKNQFPAGGYIFRPQNMGDSINSNLSEYLPSLTIDDNTIIFTRRVKTGGSHLNEDFYVSERKNASWEKATALPGELNTESNEGAQNISIDGKLLFFAANYGSEGEGNFHLYISNLNKTG